MDNIKVSKIAKNTLPHVHRIINVCFGPDYGCLLSQLLYWDQALEEEKREQWFYRSADLIWSWTGISERKQSKMFKFLGEIGFIDCDYRNMPAQRFIKINDFAIGEFYNWIGGKTSSHFSTVFESGNKNTQARIKRAMRWFNNSSFLSKCNEQNKTLKTPPVRENKTSHRHIGATLKNKKTAKGNANPAVYCPFVSYWNSFDHVRKHKNPSTSVYKQAKKLISKLKSGSFSILVFDSRWMSSRNISKQDISRKWTSGEIKQGLVHLSLLFHPSYWPANKESLPKDLSNLLYNPRTQKSMFLLFAKDRPQELRETAEHDDLFPEITEMVTDWLAQWDGETISYSHNELVGNLNRLRSAIDTYNEKQTRTWDYVTVSEYLEYLKTNNISKPSIGLFSPDCHLFSLFIGR